MLLEINNFVRIDDMKCGGRKSINGHQPEKDFRLCENFSATERSLLKLTSYMNRNQILVMFIFGTTLIEVSLMHK